MRRLATVQENALNDLMDRLAERLHLYLIRCLQDEAEAADLPQETFLRVYQSRARLDPTRRFSAWLFPIAGNLIRDRFRWRLRHPADSLDADTDATGESIRNTLPQETLSPLENLQNQERADAVRRAVSTLPEELRQPLILAEYEQLSQLEIGLCRRICG